jgi:hypothetical protein
MINLTGIKRRDLRFAKDGEKETARDKIFPVRE